MGGKKKEIPRWARVGLALGVAILLAAFAGFMIWRPADKLDRFYEHQAEQTAQAYQDTARVHAEYACGRLTKPEIRECVHKEYHAARERERQEYDLQAQLVSSVWTRAMGQAAVVGMVVGIIGVGLIWATFRETRRAANSAYATYRAFVRVEDASLIVAFPIGNQINLDRTFFSFRCSVSNVGRSSARIHSCKIGTEHFTVEHTLDVGKTFELAKRVIVANLDDPIEGHLTYSTALHDGARVFVKAKIRPDKTIINAYRGRVTELRTEYPEEKDERT